MPNVSAASMEPCVSCPFWPSTAKADCPLRNKPRAHTGPKDRSKSHRRAQPVHGKAGKRRGRTRCSTRGYATRGELRGGRSTVAFAANLKLGWFRLSTPLHCQPEDFVLHLGFQNSPHEIPFLRPQVRQALVPLTGNGVLRLSEIEDNGTVFNNYRVARRREEVFDRAHKGFRSHSGTVSGSPPTCL
jgi:hypothetical protein